MISLNNIKRVLGNFWFLIWLDSWLIKNILKLYLYIISARIVNFITNIYNQASIDGAGALYIYSNIPIKCTLKKLEKAFNTVLDLLSKVDKPTIKDLAANTINKDYVAYQLSCNITLSAQISYDIYFSALSSLPSADYFIKNNILYIAKAYEVTFDSCIKKNKLYTILNDELVTINYIWCKSLTYKDVLGSYCRILLLPLLWSVKYPSVVSRAFRAHFLGLSVLDALVMLNTIVGDDSCSFYDYKSLITEAILPKLLLISTVGPVIIENTTYTVELLNLLPISSDSVCYEEYKSMSMKSTLPYTELAKGAEINSLQFLIKKCWKKRFGLFTIPLAYFKLLLPIIAFIIKNIPKSAIIFIIPQHNIKDTYLLNLQKQIDAVYYYKNKYNNKYYNLILLDPIALLQ